MWGWDHAHGKSNRLICRGIPILPPSLSSQLPSPVEDSRHCSCIQELKCMVYGHIIIAKMRKNTNLHPDGRKPASGLRFSQSSSSRVTVLAISKNCTPSCSASPDCSQVDYSGLVSWRNLLDPWGCQEGNHSISRD